MPANHNNTKSASQVKINVQDPKKSSCSARKATPATGWLLITFRTLLFILCTWSLVGLVHRAQLMYDYPSVASYYVAKPGEGVTDFDISTCLLVSFFGLLGFYAVYANQSITYKQHIIVGFITSCFLILPLLCGGELKSSYDALTDRMRLMNRDIGFWQLNNILGRSSGGKMTGMELVNKIQGLGCCGITNASQWVDGGNYANEKLHLDAKVPLYPESCCEPPQVTVCYDELCACKPYQDGCLEVTFESLSNYFFLRYLQIADLLLISLISYVCLRLRVKAAKKQRASNMSQV